VGPLGLGGCGIFLGYPDYRVVFMRVRRTLLLVEREEAQRAYRYLRSLLVTWSIDIRKRSL